MLGRREPCSSYKSSENQRQSLRYVIPVNASNGANPTAGTGLGPTIDAALSNVPEGDYQEA